MPFMIDHLTRKPILVNIGVLMIAVVALSIVSMASSAFIAETNEGMATAINQSGSLRMQSYRIGVALTDESLPADTRADQARDLAEEFETRLNSPRLLDAIPGHTADAVNRQYAEITQLWERQMKQPLANHIALLASNAALGSQAPPRAEYLAGVDAFVSEIDHLVPLLEEVAEQRTDDVAIRGTLLVTTREDEEDNSDCWQRGCRACLDLEQSQRFHLEAPCGTRTQVMSFPVGDQEQRFGVLLMDLPLGKPLEPWQERLLATLAGHIGTALNLQQRMRESRRLVLHEERGIIARELHDSLAQSLSYLKIQVTRLSAALDAPDDAGKAKIVLSELRQGISSAYRQLRELLTTFRLKMDDRGLSRALEETVQEFRGRSATEIRLDNRLPSSALSPNEEIHVLQIVREALSNVIRHAGANNARISLAAHGPRVEVGVCDDGRGYAPPKDRARHYGMTIMRERALSLDGELRLESQPGGGTRVQLSFRPRSIANDDALETEMRGAA